jgi:hypothetical protein
VDVTYCTRCMPLPAHSDRDLPPTVNGTYCTQWTVLTAHSERYLLHTVNGTSCTKWTVLTAHLTEILSSAAVSTPVGQFAERWSIFQSQLYINSSTAVPYNYLSLCETVYINRSIICSWNLARALCICTDNHITDIMPAINRTVEKRQTQ